MRSNRTHPLGEGWPAADIAGRAENRKNCGPLLTRALQLRAGSSRTLQERTGSVGTPLAQRSGLSFALRSEQERLAQWLADHHDGETLEVAAARCVHGHVTDILNGKKPTRQTLAAIDHALIEFRK